MQNSRAATRCLGGPVPRAVISRWAPVGWPGERGANRSRARCLRGAHPPLRGAASALGVTPSPTVQPGLPRAAAGWFAAGLPVVSPTNHVLIEVGSEPYKPAPGRPESRPWGRGHCAQAGVGGRCLDPQESLHPRPLEGAVRAPADWNEGPFWVPVPGWGPRAWPGKGQGGNTQASSRALGPQAAHRLDSPLEQGPWWFRGQMAGRGAGGRALTLGRGRQGRMPGRREEEAQSRW